MLLVFGFSTRSTYAKRASAGKKKRKDNAAAFFYFLNYLSFLRPAAMHGTPVNKPCITSGSSMRGVSIAQCINFGRNHLGTRINN
jgi:hypothetical protein